MYPGAALENKWQSWKDCSLGHRDSVIPSFWSGRGSDKTASDHSETMIDKGSGLSVGIISNLLQMLTKKCNKNLSKISLLEKKNTFETLLIRQDYYVFVGLSQWKISL